MSNTKVQVYVRQLEKSRNATLTAAKGAPTDNQLRQVQAGKATPLWLVGHLANTLNTVVLRWMFEADSMLTKDQARLFSPDFAGGTPPSTDPSVYPPYQEVVDTYEKISGRAIELIGTLSDEALPEPLQGKVPDALRDFFSSNEATIMQMVHHDAYHCGQLALLSKLPA
jgi:hypothetical protein